MQAISSLREILEISRCIVMQSPFYIVLFFELQFCVEHHESVDEPPASLDGLEIVFPLFFFLSLKPKELFHGELESLEDLHNS